MPERPGLGLQLQSVTRTYQLGASRIPVLDQVDLAIEPGDVVALVGPSGSGKSTLLALLGLLDRPTSGRILFDGVDLRAQDEDAMEEFRNLHIGFVFQFHHLLPEFTGLENVMLPAIIAGLSMTRARARAEDLLARVGLLDRAAHAPGELSGGEQQRVALARALVLGPRLVLADEPTGNLDPRTGEDVWGLLLDLNADLGTTLVVATHNLDLAARMPRRLVLGGGRVVDALMLERFPG
jgi:lipoprotein-releasing system ATP-binding protein